MSRRPHHETRDAGAQPRTEVTLEQLSRYLETLEAHLVRSRDDIERPPAKQHPAGPDRSATAGRFDDEAGEEQACRSIAAGIERLLAQQEGVETAGRIADELTALRDELRSRTSAGFRAELNSLLGDVKRAHAQRGDGRGHELAGELERISGAVQALAERSDEAGVPVFSQEMEEVMDMLESLASEATARSVDGHPEAQGRRAGNLGDRVAASDRGGDLRLTAMEARLEEIAGAVDRLPRSLSLRPLEDKLKMLATAVEHFVSRPPSVGPEIFTQIELRLDEISRAIVASAIAAQSPQVDPEPFQRIEARIAGLARQIEEVAADRPPGEVIERLDSLSERIDEMALRAEVPARSLQLLSEQIADIAGKLDRASSLPGADAVLSGIEQRFDILSGALERRQSEAVEQENLILRDLERRLDGIAGELRLAPPGPDPVSLFSGLERRFDALSDSLERRQGEAVEQENLILRDLERRLDGIAGQLRQVPGGPDPVSLFSGLERRFEALSESLERRQVEAADQENLLLRQLERYLHEIAGKLGQAPAKADPDPLFSGLERRFEALSESLEQRQGEAIDQGNLLLREVERCLHEIAGRLGQAPAEADTKTLVSGMEKRLDALAGELERIRDESIEQGNLLLREFGRRLEEVTGRIEQRQSGAAQEGGALLNAIDARLASVAERLEEGARGNGSAPMHGLETRLDDISQRLDAVASRFAGVDTELVRSLEAQVAGISAHLLRPAGPLPELEDIAPRLDEIEKRIADSRQGLLQAARDAAENAVCSLSASDTGSAAVAGLVDEFKALETLARRSDERNSRTFEAIHDTLLKIADRLGSLETATGADGDKGPPAGPREADVARSIDPEGALRHGPATASGQEAAPLPKGRVELSPAEAAAAAAAASLASEENSAGERRGVRSMLGGLFSGRKEHDAHVAPEPEAENETAVEPQPPASLDEPLDPSLANRPLEPGSGAPDLNAIMRRVRDERGQTGRADEADAAKSDFIAAARRAARAAAAEAEVLKSKSDIGGPVKALRIGDLLKSRRKPILMAGTGIVIALSGLQLGKSFMNDAVEIAAEEATVVSEKKLSAASPGSWYGPRESGSGKIAMAAAAPVGGTAMQGFESDTAQPAAAPSPTQIQLARPPASDTRASEVVAARGADAASAPAPAPSPVSAEVPVDAGPAALRQAANSGDARALFEVASRFAEGRGTRKDLAEAAKWYEKAAELGLAPAQFRIGNLYEKGLGVARDIARSRTWYERAAAQGNSGAMHNLAVLFAMGADGASDNEKAARWFASAAALGVKDSQFNLGVLAAKGAGMRQDLEESYKWFALAARSGDEDAAAKRDEIAAAMDAEQLEKARAATEIWKPKPLDAAANAVEVPAEWLGDETAVATGTSIRDVQLILNENGFDAGSPDGVIGAQTRTAITRFQEDHGLKPTGEVDAALVQTLLARQ